MVAAAGGVGSVDAHDDGNAHLVELRVAVEGRAAAPAVGVHQFLLIQLYAGALQQVDQGDTQPLGGVAAPEQVVSLARHPGTGVLLVVGSDDHAPLAVDAAQSFNNRSRPRFVVVGVIEAVQGAPGAGIHQQGDPLHGGKLALGVHSLVGLSALQAGHNLGMDVLLNGLELGHVLRIGADSLANSGHVLEIAGHRVITQCKLLLLTNLKVRLAPGWPEHAYLLRHSQNANQKQWDQEYHRHTGLQSIFISQFLTPWEP